MHEPKAPVAPLKFDRENVRAAVQKSGAIRRPGTTHEPELSTTIEHTNELQASRERSARRWAGTQLRGKTGGQLLLFTGASAADGSSLKPAAPPVLPRCGSKSCLVKGCRKSTDVKRIRRRHTNCPRLVPPTAG